MSEGFPKLFIVWKGVLKQIDKPVFSSGDAYVLDNDNTIYIWLGINCSVDEKGVAAIEAQKLDKDRKGVAKIVTVDQASETPDFLEAVGKIGAMRIVDKNLVGSMLKNVETGSWAGHMEHVNALYRVSSEEFAGDLNAMKFIQVPFEKSSLDSEDVFIADLGDEILVWVGNQSNAKEKVMAGKWARQFDAERAGAQKLTYFNEGEDAEFVDKCWGKGIVKASSKMVQLDVEKMKSAEDSSVQLFDEEPAPAPKAPAPVATKSAAPKPAAAAMKKEPAAPAKVEPKPKVEEPAPAVASSAESARWVCPHCNNNDRRMIREVPDKSILLNAYPPVYGKKLVCGKCGKDWHHK